MWSRARLKLKIWAAQVSAEEVLGLPPFTILLASSLSVSSSVS